MKNLDGDVIYSPSDGFTRGEDSVTGVHPVYIFAGGAAGRVGLLWGNTIPQGVPPEFLISPELRYEPVTRASVSRVETFSQYPGETWLTTFLPMGGIVFATRHKIFEWPDLGWIASATTFEMRCRFDPFPG